jgi:hypothetical protein
MTAFMNISPRRRFALVLACISVQAFVLTLLSGCGQKSGTVMIADVTRTNEFQLVTTAWSGVRGDLPSGLSVEVNGQIEGTAYIAIEQMETQRVSGAVRWRIGGDWFRTNCVFRYQPENVKIGWVTVKFRFQ